MLVPPQWEVVILELPLSSGRRAPLDLVIVGGRSIAAETIQCLTSNLAPDCPLVVFTECTVGNFRSLGPLRVDALLVAGHDDEQVPEILRRVVRRSPLFGVAEVAESWASCPPILRHALSVTLRDLAGASQAHPVCRPTVTLLSRRVGCSREHLSRLGRVAGVAVPDLLGRAVLLQALYLRRRSRARWRDISRCLGFGSPRSLAKLARRFTGKSLRSLEDSEPISLLRSTRLGDELSIVVS